MKTVTTVIAALAMMTIVSLESAHAKDDDALLVPGMPVARDIANAMEIPDPATNYKVVFSVNRDPQNPDDIDPMLRAIATYVNTLGKYGVPRKHRNIVAMIHHRSESFDIVMNNEAYKARYGRDNPNIDIIRKLKQAGVDIRLCGQGLVGREIDPEDVNPDIQVDLWAMTSIVNLTMAGYGHIG